MKKLFFLLPVALFLVAFTRPQTSNEVAPEIPADIKALLDRHTCTTCHHIERKMMGPSYTAIASKNYSKKQIIELVKKPVPSNWPGFAPMAPLTNIPKGDLDKMANWLSKLGK